MAASTLLMGSPPALSATSISVGPSPPAPPLPPCRPRATAASAPSALASAACSRRRATSLYSTCYLRGTKGPDAGGDFGPYCQSERNSLYKQAEGHVPNTLRQALIYKALGFPMPSFAHVSLILAPDRSNKLSPDRGATSVGQVDN
ncbi:hypothetical protein ACP70R_008813 [Stipagrostis hirtigluma subsp. patula]